MIYNNIQYNMFDYNHYTNYTVMPSIIMEYYCNTFFSSILVLLSLATLAFPSVYLQLSGCQRCQYQAKSNTDSSLVIAVRPEA